jgi:hypothetical protein
MRIARTASMLACRERIAGSGRVSRASRVGGRTRQAPVRRLCAAHQKSNGRVIVSGTV